MSNSTSPYDLNTLALERVKPDLKQVSDPYTLRIETSLVAIYKKNR